MIKATHVLLVAALCGLGCGSGGDGDGPPATHRDMMNHTRELYEQYAAALSAGDRPRLASFYHPDGALFVINGDRRLLTSRQAIDSVYTGPSWNPPQFFAFEGLAFDSLAPDEVAVTGGFRWQSAGRPDTSHWRYAALVTPTDSGVGIRFEHETRLERGTP